MSTRRRSSRSDLLLGVLALALAAVPRGVRADESADEARLRATYPMTVPSTTRAAGLDIAKIALPGLHLELRDDRSPAEGGTSLVYADDQGQVQLTLRFAVAVDPRGARSFLYARLRGISTTLVAAPLDELAFADDGGRATHLVAGAHGNIAYVIDAREGGPITARDATTKIASAIVAGAPTFPQATLGLPPSMPLAGATLSLVSPANTTVRFVARNAYVSRSRASTKVHPAKAGPVEVTAIVADSLGRVTEVTASSLAQ